MALAPGTARRRVVVAALLALGWGAAIAIYATASPAEEDPWLAGMESSREYERQVEVLGGRGALLAHDLTRWFEGLWHGQSLAYTVAFLTVVVALAYYAWDRLRTAA